MTALLTDIGLLAVIGAAVNLDRRGAFQAMISQPIVVVPLLGLLFGAQGVLTGVWLGAVLQLLWMSVLLVGASAPPNETLASVAIGGMTFVYGAHFGEVDQAVMALAVLFGAPVADLGRRIEVRIERANLALARRADEGARAGAPAVLGRLPFIGLARTYISAVGLIAPAIALGTALIVGVRPRLEGALERAFEVVGLYIIPALGLAVALSMVRRRSALAIAAVTFLAVVAFAGQLPGMA